MAYTFLSSHRTLTFGTVLEFQMLRGGCYNCHKPVLPGAELHEMTFLFPSE